MKNFLTIVCFVLALVTISACSAANANLIATPISATADNTAAPPSAPQGAILLSPTPELVAPTPLATATAPVAALPSPATPSPFAPEMAEELTFNLINQQGGAISGVAAMDQTVFVGAGPRLIVVDIVNPTEPQTLGQSELLPGLVQSVLVRDNRAYVGAGSSIIIFDVSNPQLLTLLGELSLSEPVFHLALGGETLVVAMAAEPNAAQENGSGTIVTIDVSQPEQPQLLDSVALPWYVNAIALADETVYASNPAEANFFAIDISLPGSLPDPVPFPVAALTYSLQVRGHTLYVGGGGSNITAWDVTVLAEPQKLWEIGATPDPDFGLGVVNGFVFAETTAYLDAASYHGQVLGPLALKLPEPIASKSGDLVSSEITIQDDLLLMTQTTLDLYTINDESVKPEARYHIPGIFPGPQAVALAGNNGLVISQEKATENENGRLSLIQLPELNFLDDYMDSISCESCDAGLAKIEVVGDLAYVTGGDSTLRIFTINDPGQLALVAAYVPADFDFGWRNLYDLSVANERGYAVGQANDRAVLVALNLSDPHNVQVDAKIDWVGGAEQVAASENSVYLATTLFTDRAAYELRRYVPEDHELILTGSVEVGSQVYDIVIKDEVALLGTVDGLTIVSTDAATGQLKIIAQEQIPGGLWDLALIGDVLLATTAEFWGNGRLLAVDVHDLTQPRLIGMMPLPSGKAELAARDEGTIVVGNKAMGLMVLEAHRK